MKDQALACVTCGGPMHRSPSADFCSNECMTTYYEDAYTSGPMHPLSYTTYQTAVEHASDPLCTCGCIAAAADAKYVALRMEGLTMVSRDDLAEGIADDIRSLLAGRAQQQAELAARAAEQIVDLPVRYTVLARWERWVRAALAPVTRVAARIRRKPPEPDGWDHWLRLHMREVLRAPSHRLHPMMPLIVSNPDAETMAELERRMRDGEIGPAGILVIPEGFEFARAEPAGQYDPTPGSRVLGEPLAIDFRDVEDGVLQAAIQRRYRHDHSCTERGTGQITFFTKIAVGIDPATALDGESPTIVVAGVTADGTTHVIDRWAPTVAEVYRLYTEEMTEGRPLAREALLGAEAWMPPEVLASARYTPLSPRGHTTTETTLDDPVTYPIPPAGVQP